MRRRAGIRINRRSAGVCNALRRSEGQALLEAALLLPFLLLLILNTANLGLYIYAYITVDGAARSAVQYAVYNGVVVNFADKPTFAQIQSLVNNDVSSLPHYAASTNPTLKVCSNANGTVTCSGSGTGTAPADPDPTHYVSYSADVSYTYTPITSVFSFSSLGLVPLASTIHRQAVMRSMQ